MKPSPERAAAIAAGERFYFTGTPCSRGHLSKRYVARSVCAQCAVESTMRSAAKRPWHPARLAAKERGDIHYSIGKKCPHGHDKRSVKSGLCAPCGLASARRWDARNKERNAATTRARRAKDPTNHRAEVKRWAQKNREKVRAMLLRWKKANPERVRELGRAGTNNRRTRVAANGGSFTADDIATIFQRQNGCCAACLSKENLEIDHIVPIVRGGSSDPSNLQLLCLPCNRSKGSKTMKEWLSGNPRLRVEQLV